MMISGDLAFGLSKNMTGITSTGILTGYGMPFAALLGSIFDLR